MHLGFQQSWFQFIWARPYASFAFALLEGLCVALSLTSRTVHLKIDSMRSVFQKLSMARSIHDEKLSRKS